MLEMSTQAIKLMFGPNSSGERLLNNSQTRICFQKRSHEIKLLNEWLNQVDDVIDQYNLSKSILNRSSNFIPHQAIYKQQVTAICACADVPDLKYTGVKMSLC